MSRSSHHKEKYGKSSGISQDHHHEGTAARTRPLSFDEIMLKRKKKKKLFDDEKGVTEDITVDRNTVKVTERDNGRNKDSSPGVQKHLPEGDAKASSRKKKENTSMKDYNLANCKDRKILDSETKLKPKMDKDLKTKGWTEGKIHGRRKSDEQLSNITEIESSDKHSEHLTHIARHVDGRRGKSERNNKRKDQNGVDEKNRDMYPTRKHDLRKGYDSETLDRKERKETSKSHYEELKLKRRRSRSREGVERNRRSISPFSQSQKRASYHSREHGELSLYSNKGRSERQHSDFDWSKNTNNGSSGQHKRHGGSTSRLGGYSPRKRRTEAAAKTPSPTKRSPEKKSAKWDLALEGSHSTLSVSVVPSNLQLPQKTIALNFYEAVSAVAVPSITVKPFSGVSSNSLSTNKNGSVDSVQLTQATRPMRRLYVENIPASASEKAVMECLNNFLISSGVSHIKGTQPCISCIIHKEKGQALVEFLTPEDASAALIFDGSVFSGSIIKIRRPKDFVELATGEPEKSVAAVDIISNIVKDSPHKIFIGGISKLLSSKMIMEIASAFGPLKSYHFENSDDHNGASAFLEYADQSVTFRACAGLNGMKLGGQVITVLQVDPNASTLESSINPPFYGIPDHAEPLLEKPTQVVKLKNLFDPENLPSLSDTEIEEVLEDVRLECVRFGTVKSVNFVKYGSAPSSTLEACEVNEDIEFARSRQNLDSDEMDAKTETLKDSTDYTIAKGDGVEDDKHAHVLVQDESCQPGHFDSDISVENLPVKSILESQELARQTLKDESGFGDDNVIGNIHVRDSSVEDKLPFGMDSNLAEVSGDSREDFVDDHVIESDAIEKGLHEEENCDLGYIFEPGCVFVEFVRAEASSAAAHCLHGRLFDNRTVTVGYIPLDVYRSRFPK